MPNSYTVMGVNVGFGCSGAGVQINGSDVAIGFIQSCKKSNSMKKWEGKDSDGKVRSIVVYDSGGTVNATIILNANATLPEQGDTLTVGGVTGLIESVDVNWQNEQGTQLDLTASWSEGVDSTQVAGGGGTGT